MNNFKYVNSKSGVLKVASQQEKIPQSDEKLCLYHSRKICPEKGNTGIFLSILLLLRIRKILSTYLWIWFCIFNILKNHPH